MVKWKLLTLEDFDEWSRLVDSCEQSDIHFTPTYLRIFEEKMGGKAMLFVKHSENGENFLLYPFFKRRINDLALFSSYKRECFDIISPWYFGGPLLHSKENTTELIRSFQNEFLEFVTSNDIIAEFTRLHPLLEGSKEFSHLTKADYRYDISYVDLKYSLDEIWKNFKKSNRNAITAAKRKDITVEFSSTMGSLKTFFELYIKSMKRINADKFYFFPFEFFENMLTNLNKNMIIATAQHNGMAISSSILLFKSGFVHYWLTGSDFEFRNLYPNNLLLHESIIWAKNMGHKLFILMGGSNPSLRAFKESFSNSKASFNTLSRIYNDVVYSELATLRRLANKDNIQNIDFFPQYRI